MALSNNASRLLKWPVLRQAISINTIPYCLHSGSTIHVAMLTTLFTVFVFFRGVFFVRVAFPGVMFPGRFSPVYSGVLLCKRKASKQ